MAAIAAVHRRTRDVVAKVKTRRSLGWRDILGEIELIEQPKQLAARGPDTRHAVGAGEFRRKFLLPENEDLKFGYGVHWVSFAFIRKLYSRYTPDHRPRAFRAAQPTLAVIGSG